jgi:hypothetical protein
MAAPDAAQLAALQAQLAAVFTSMVPPGSGAGLTPMTGMPEEGMHGAPSLPARLDDFQALAPAAGPKPGSQLAAFAAQLRLGAGKPVSFGGAPAFAPAPAPSRPADAPSGSLAALPPMLPALLLSILSAGTAVPAAVPGGPPPNSAAAAAAAAAAAVAVASLLPSSFLPLLAGGGLPPLPFMPPPGVGVPPLGWQPPLGGLGGSTATPLSTALPFMGQGSAQLTAMGAAAGAGVGIGLGVGVGVPPQLASNPVRAAAAAALARATAGRHASALAAATMSAQSAATTLGPPTALGPPVGYVGWNASSPEAAAAMGSAASRPSGTAPPGTAGNPLPFALLGHLGPLEPLSGVASLTGTAPWSAQLPHLPSPAGTVHLLPPGAVGGGAEGKTPPFATACGTQLGSLPSLPLPSAGAGRSEPYPWLGRSIPSLTIHGDGSVSFAPPQVPGGVQSGRGGGVRSFLGPWGELLPLLSPLAEGGMDAVLQAGDALLPATSATASTSTSASAALTGPTVDGLPPTQTYLTGLPDGGEPLPVGGPGQPPVTLLSGDADAHLIILQGTAEAATANAAIEAAAGGGGGRLLGATTPEGLAALRCWLGRSWGASYPGLAVRSALCAATGLSPHAIVRWAKRARAENSASHALAACRPGGPGPLPGGTGCRLHGADAPGMDSADRTALRAASMVLLAGAELGHALSLAAGASAARRAAAGAEAEVVSVAAAGEGSETSAEGVEPPAVARPPSSLVSQVSESALIAGLASLRVASDNGPLSVALPPSSIIREVEDIGIAADGVLLALRGEGGGDRRIASPAVSALLLLPQRTPAAAAALALVVERRSLGQLGEIASSPSLQGGAGADLATYGLAATFPPVLPTRKKARDAFEGEGASHLFFGGGREGLTLLRAAKAGGHVGARGGAGAALSPREALLARLESTVARLVAHGPSGSGVELPPGVTWYTGGALHAPSSPTREDSSQPRPAGPTTRTTSVVAVPGVAFYFPSACASPGATAAALGPAPTLPPRVHALLAVGQQDEGDEDLSEVEVEGAARALLASHTLIAEVRHERGGGAPVDGEGGAGTGLHHRRVPELSAAEAVRSAAAFALGRVLLLPLGPLSDPAVRAAAVRAALGVEGDAAPGHAPLPAVPSAQGLQGGARAAEY